MRHEGRTVFVVNTMPDSPYRMIAKTVVSTLCSLSIEYDVNCPTNTYEASDMVQITRKEFLEKVKLVKAKYKVQITIKS